MTGMGEGAANEGPHIIIVFGNQNSGHQCPANASLEWAASSDAAGEMSCAASPWSGAAESVVEAGE